MTIIDCNVGWYFQTPKISTFARYELFLLNILFVHSFPRNFYWLISTSNVSTDMYYSFLYFYMKAFDLRCKISPFKYLVIWFGGPVILWRIVNRDGVTNVVQKFLQIYQQHRRALRSIIEIFLQSASKVFQFSVS